jgi:prophage regulatory protein
MKRGQTRFILLLSESFVGGFMTRIYRLKDVLQLTGLGRSTLYRYVKQGSFPKPIKLSGSISDQGAVGWTQTMLDTWFEQLEDDDAENP